MVLVEFYDENCIENIACTLQYQPDEVVLIGHSHKRLTAACQVYEQLTAARGMTVRFTCRTVTRNDLSEIVEAIESVLELDRDCVFELTGGDEMYLVAAGVVAGRHREKVHLSRMNLPENKIKRMLPRGSVTAPLQIGLTVAENIRIYGGQLSEESENWRFDEAFCRDIDVLWDVCRHFPKWNSAVVALSTLGARSGGALSLPTEEGSLRQLMLRLVGAGMLVSSEKGYRFKNAQVHRALQKAGQVLELWVAKGLLAAREGNEKMFSDVRVGAMLDWDERSTVDVGNEIDVLAIKGALPLFISCKNGKVDSEELYKLSQVADRFGGTYAKKALVVRQLETGSSTHHLRARAGEMGIELLEIERLGEEKVLSRLQKM